MAVFIFFVNSRAVMNAHINLKSHLGLTLAL